MINILIHACKERNDYVYKYLVPRLDHLLCVDVDVYTDNNHIGNQMAFYNSIEEYIPYTGNTWHLQDDVWPSNDAIKVMELYDNIPGIICGFGTRASSRGKVPGWTTPAGMYMSFQCIRIPNDLLLYFKEYLEKHYLKNGKMETDKWDDALFLEFLLRKAPFYPVLNLAPSIVEHVDYLIGGSIINKDRKYLPTAIEFDEKSLDVLKRRLNKNA